MAEQFNAILTGETSPERGAKTLQSDPEKIIEQGENLWPKAVLRKERTHGGSRHQATGFRSFVLKPVA